MERYKEHLNYIDRTLRILPESSEITLYRMKKWFIVLDQISLHKSKQKPIVVCCAQGIVPRLGEDEFQTHR